MGGAGSLTCRRYLSLNLFFLHRMAYLCHVLIWILSLCRTNIINMKIRPVDLISIIFYPLSNRLMNLSEPLVRSLQIAPAYWTAGSVLK